MASIPDLDSPAKKEPTTAHSQPADTATDGGGQEAVAKPTDNTASAAESTENAGHSNENPAEAVSSADSTPAAGVKASDDTRYRKFFKMLQFGVPAPAVKLKMQTEGVDPSILE